MADTVYLVRYKAGDQPPEVVIAETIEFHGEHLVFLKIGRFPGCAVRLGDH
jgi:hypothetical protein